MPDDITAARLPKLVPDQLDAAQRAVYDAITGGDRAKGPRHFPLTDADGALGGPFGVMLHSPGVGGTLQDLGAKIRFHTDLTARVREAAILQVARVLGSDYEWWAHTRVGRAAGLTDDEIASLSSGSYLGADPVEAASATLVAILLESNVVNDEQFAVLSEALSTQQIVDLTVLVGYYRTLAQLMAVFDVGVPED